MFRVQRSAGRRNTVHGSDGCRAQLGILLRAPSRDTERSRVKVKTFFLAPSRSIRATHASTAICFRIGDRAVIYGHFAIVSNRMLKLNSIGLRAFARSRGKTRGQISRGDDLSLSLHRSTKSQSCRTRVDRLINVVNLLKINDRLIRITT